MDLTLDSRGATMLDQNNMPEQADVENQSSDKSKQDSTKLGSFKDQFGRLWEQPKYRASFLLVGVGAIVGAGFLFSGDNTASSATTVNGENTSAAKVEVDSAPIDADQAKYLEDARRDEALKAANEGTSNAAVIVTPSDNLYSGFSKSASAYDDPQANFVGTTTDTTTAEPVGSAKYAHITFRGASVHNHPDLKFTKDSTTGEQYFFDQKTNTIYNISNDGMSLIAKDNPNAAYSTVQNQSSNTPSSSNNNSSSGSGSGGDSSSYTAGDDNQEGQGDSAPAPYDALEDSDIKYHNANLSYNFETVQYNNTQFQNQQAAAQQQAATQAALLSQQRQAAAQNALNTAINRTQRLHMPSASYSAKTYNVNSVETEQEQGRYNQPSSTAGNTQTAPSTPLTSEQSQNTNSSYSSYQGNGNSNLPKHIIRAGTTWQVVVTKTANSDAGNVVEARIANGPFAGSTVYGQMSPKGRDITVVFTSLQRPNPRLPILALRASATNIRNNRAEVSTDVNRHYLQNYTYAAAASVLKGYGDAYSSRNQAQTTVERSDGTVITSRDGSSTIKEVRANIAQDFSNRLQQDIAHLGERPPTFIIKAGTALNMRITSDWDTTQTTSVIPE